jgi:hypothetical protein
MFDVTSLPLSLGESWRKEIAIISFRASKGIFPEA